MPGISRDNDSAGGDLIPSQSTVFANNEEVIVDGDRVASHGLSPHNSPTMIAGSNNVFVENIAVCNAGDNATCGHSASGSGDVFVGDPGGSGNVTDPVLLNTEVFDLPVFITQEEARELIDWKDPTHEGLEYGDGGISAARRSNTSPVTQEQGPIPAPASDTGDGVEETPSEQPTNENGEYIIWLSHVDTRVKPQVVTNLENVSKAVGYALKVTSGYRSPDYNSKVGGAKKSQHMQGNAVDIVQTGLTQQQRQEFIQAAIDNGFTAIGVYNTFTHIDIRGAKVAWGSNGSRTGLPKYPWAQQVLGNNGYATS